LLAGGHQTCSASIMSFYTPVLKFESQRAWIQLIVSSPEATSNMFRIYAAILRNLEQNVRMLLAVCYFLRGWKSWRVRNISLKFYYIFHILGVTFD
jgi:hypothetical protein